MRKIDDCKIFGLTQIGDERGNLIVIEGKSQIPFEIKRLFYIFGTDSNATRGEHAKINSEFIMICVSGSCKVRLFDGYAESIMCLKSPDCALYIPKMIWKEMFDFSKNCVLLVLSNMPYDAKEYIRDKNEYINRNR